MFVGIERFADGGDGVVHHAGGRDDIGTGAGVDDGLGAETLNGGIVIDGTLRRERTAVAVVGVFAVAQVGDGEHVDAGIFGHLERGADGVVGIVGVRAEGIFFVFVRDAEEDERGQAELLEAFEFGDGDFRRHLKNAGHGDDGVLDLLAKADEERGDEILR